MSKLAITLSADASALQAVLDRMKPIADRLDAQVRESEPDSPASRLELAFEDVFEALKDCGLLVDVTVSGMAGSVLADLTVTPSPVLDRLCDLLTAICDGIDASAAKDAA